MSDFSDRPFVAGSLTGLRAFGVDDLGRLVGPAYGGVFKPGENEAACRTTFAPKRAWMFNPARYGWTAPTATLTFATSLPVAAEAKEEEPEVDETPLVEHTTGGLDCTCGYYAYFDGCNDYEEPDRVSAVVEGYGVCTVGNRGFRASKARLVALILPDGAAAANPGHPAWYDRYADWLNRKNVGPFIAAPALIAGIIAVSFAVGMSIDTSPLYALLMPPGLALMLFCGVTAKAEFHGIDREFRAPHRLSTCAIPARRAPETHLEYATIRRNYPVVPVYGSVKAALAAHPLTPPEPDPLPTPDDEDFWTREVPR